MKKNTNLIIGTVFTSLTGCMTVIILLVLWTDRTLDFWCTHFSGHAVNVPLWLSAIATFVGNVVMLILNIISEIVRLCM